MGDQDNVVQFSPDQEEALKVIEDAREMLRRGEVSAVMIAGAGKDGFGFHSFFIPPGTDVAMLAGNVEIAKARVMAELDMAEEYETS